VVMVGHAECNWTMRDRDSDLRLGWCHNWGSFGKISAIDQPIKVTTVLQLVAMRFTEKSSSIQQLISGC
jgi:hypothetical protein